MTEPTAADFDSIAKSIGIETLEVRNRDALDFHDLHVTTLRRALAAAFAAGAAAVSR